MNTPICDFVREYARSNALRLHMPGHKGASFLGIEHLDITEIDGADSLYEAGGIIAQSEDNASTLFGCRTFYSTEGSSQCIRAMLYLVLLMAKQTGNRPLIAAGRNAHRTFLTAAALLDLDVDWLHPRENTSHLSCVLTPRELEDYLQKKEEKPAAVYLTSPDYLGNIADIRALAEVCHRYGVCLLVDNAHGSYLKFLPESLHPIDLGADLCCDSAHKTLPVLTGGAYLHISPAFESLLAPYARNALALFGSTSPSYLILQSLDQANAYLEGYRTKLRLFLSQIGELKRVLLDAGFRLVGTEPLKITILTKSVGYLGTELARILAEQEIVCEFADPDHLVLMLTPEHSSDDLRRLRSVLLAIDRKAPLISQPPLPGKGTAAMSIREAIVSPFESVPVEESLGRILANPSVGCPPAVPILVCGERIDAQAIVCFQYYGIKALCVVK